MAKTQSVAGQVVAITGAARGIGAATARELARRGATLALIGIEPERLEEIVRELGASHAFFEADVTDQSAVDAAFAATVAKFGRIDVLIANAGIVNYGTVRTADPNAFARTIDINLTGVYRAVHAAAPHLAASRGYVLIIASLASFVPLVGASAYSASKAGVLALADTLRLELESSGVEVGTAHPSWIDTDLVRSAEDAMPSFAEMRKKSPWPANTTISVQVCAEALADAVGRRARRVYIPRSATIIAALRPLISSAFIEKSMRRRIGEFIPRLDADVRTYQERAPRRIT